MPAKAIGPLFGGLAEDEGLGAAQVFQSYKPSAGSRQRLPRIAFLNAGLSFTLSPRALISSEKSLGSFTQDGIRPQRTSANSRSPLTMRTIGTGWVGATL